MEETIVAPATPAGRGGISIIRISGNDARGVGLSLCGELPKSWSFKPCSILDGAGVLIDSGLVVFLVLQDRTQVRMLLKYTATATLWS